VLWRRSRRSTRSSNGKCRRGEKGCLESVVYPAGDRGFEPPSSGKGSVSSRGFARLCLRAADRGEPHAARRDGQGCRTAGTDRQGIRLRKESGSAFKAERIFGQAEFRWVSGRSLVKTYEAVCYQGCCALAAPVSRSRARRLRLPLNDALVGNSCFREGKLPPRRHEVPGDGYPGHLRP
jgi:hypothetical protein